MKYILLPKLVNYLIISGVDLNMCMMNRFDFKLVRKLFLLKLEFII